MAKNENEKKHYVLIVDDVPLNCKLLDKCIRNDVAKTVMVHNGSEALQTAMQTLPDLILLDVVMPGIDGYEVCERLKSAPTTQHIPVIFISSMEDASDKIKGLEVGAVDFISKPFDLSEVRARVKAQLRIKDLEDMQRTSVNNLENTVNERTKQLVASDRLAQLGTLSAGIAHEINNPTAFIRGNIQTFKRFWEVAEKVLVEAIENNHEEIERLQFIVDEVPKLTDGIEMGTKRISKIVNGLKEYVHNDGSSDMDNTPLHKIINSAVELCNSVFKGVVIIEETYNAKNDLILADRLKLEQVFVNLFTNASHALENTKDAKLTIHTKCNDEMIYITITDNGCGMDQEILDKIWNPFFTTKPVGKGTGLGMSITQGIIEEHSGEIMVSSKIGKGTTFTLIFNCVTIETPEMANV